MKNKLIFVYSVVFVFLISLTLTHVHVGFVALSLVSMGFIWGFLANESFFESKSMDFWTHRAPKYPITEGDTLSNTRVSHGRKMPSDPPPSLSENP